MTLSTQTIKDRLEEAGATLLSMPPQEARVRAINWAPIHAVIDAYGWTGGRRRPVEPTAAAITHMDETQNWLRLIPKENYILRRVIGARALVSPISRRHLFSFQRLSTLLGADEKTLRRWHEKGLEMIAAALRQKETVP